VSSFFLSRPQDCLRKMLLFDKLEADVQRKIVTEMYARKINAGDILIQEGDVGLAASELYVVKEGEFEVGRLHAEVCIDFSRISRELLADSICF